MSVHTILALVQDHPGVLHRVASLIRRRGYNIESLTVGRCEMPGVSRMTLVVDADVEQVTKQLNRLVEVLKVQDVTHDRTVERETVLVKVHAPAPSRAGLISLTTSHGARTVDVGIATLVFELTESPKKVDAFLDLLTPIGITEMIRSGRIAMAQADGSGD
ncbi:MAG TPA: acetolactate synthase small subunit [Gemmatimonadaceae bacterium]|nr:acetolactate synthase small subunit [Gemmatimonadaceae bacterium]